MFDRFNSRKPGETCGMGLIIMGEKASPVYDVEFLKSVYTVEGGYILLDVFFVAYLL